MCKLGSVVPVMNRDEYFDQYNAILELAAKGDAYSANWHGPPQDFTTWG